MVLAEQLADYNLQSERKIKVSFCGIPH